MADRFFTRDPIPAGDFVLSGPEAHHLHAVRRIGVGESIILFNGDGRAYPAEVIGVGKKSVQLIVGEPIQTDRERPFAPWIASAIPKGDRLDFLIEKLTELGAARFTPLVAERSAVRPKADVVEKYERMVIEASKQCGRNRLMSVDSPQSWLTFVHRADLPATRMVLHTGPELPKVSAGGGCAVAVGPEGGFAPEELSLAVGSGWVAASLGSRVLRVETAAVAAAAVLGNAPAN